MTVLAGAMLDDLLADPLESGLFCQNRNITMHLAIDFDRLDHPAAVGLQSAVEIMQSDSRNDAGRPVEKLARPPLPRRVMTLLFPARHQIVPLVEDHMPQSRNLVRRVLQVGVHRENHLAACFGETAIQSGGFAVVASELDPPHRRKPLVQTLDHAPRTIAGTVVHQDHLVGQTLAASYAVDPFDQLRQGLFLVVKRNDDRYVERSIHRSSTLRIEDRKAGVHAPGYRPK